MVWICDCWEYFNYFFKSQLKLNFSFKNMLMFSDATYWNPPGISFNKHWQHYDLNLSRIIIHGKIVIIYICKSSSLKFTYIPMIAQPASERALWPQCTTVSPSQRRWPPMSDTRHCARCWKAEGPRVRAPNTPPRTRTPPLPENTQTRKQPGRSLALLSLAAVIRARSNDLRM